MKVGKCGILCEECFLYKNNACEGCKENEVCPIPECANKKEIDICFHCKEFPCKLYYEKGPYEKELLDFWKEKKGSVNLRKI